MPKRKTAKKKTAHRPRAAKSTTVTTMTTKTTRTTTSRNPVRGNYATYRGHKFNFEDSEAGWYAHVEEPELDYDFGPYETWEIANEAVHWNIDSHVDQYGYGTAGPDDGRYVEGYEDNPLRLGKQDKAVIKHFVAGIGAEGHKLSTDGIRLDGHWMGGNDLAHWRDGKIHLPDTGSRSGQTVQNAVRKEAPRNDLFNGRGWNPASPGDWDRLPDKGTRIRAQAPIHRSQGGPQSRSIVVPEGATGEVVSTRYSSMGIAAIFDLPQENYIQWTCPEALDMFLRDVEIDPSSTWQPPDFNPGGKHIACGSEISDKDCRQLQHVYESAKDRGYSDKRAAKQAWGSLRNPKKAPKFRARKWTRSSDNIEYVGPWRDTRRDAVYDAKEDIAPHRHATYEIETSEGIVDEISEKQYEQGLDLYYRSMRDRSVFNPAALAYSERTMILVEEEETALQQNPAKGSGKAPTFTKVADRVYVGRGNVVSEDIYGRPRDIAVDFRLDGRDGDFYRVDKHTLGPWEAIDGGEQHAPRTLTAARAIVAKWIAAASAQHTLSPHLDRAANPAPARAKNPSSRASSMGRRISGV